MRTEPVDMVRVYACAFGVDPDKLVNAVNRAEVPPPSREELRKAFLKGELSWDELFDKLEESR